MELLFGAFWCLLCWLIFVMMPGAILMESQQVCPQGGVVRLLGSAVTTGQGVDNQVQLYETVCTDCSVDPRNVEYVEAHHDFFVPLSSAVAVDKAAVEQGSRREEELAALDKVYGWKQAAASSCTNTSALEESLELEASPRPIDTGERDTSSIQLRQVRLDAHRDLIFCSHILYM